MFLSFDFSNTRAPTPTPALLFTNIIFTFCCQLAVYYFFLPLLHSAVYYAHNYYLNWQPHTPLYLSSSVVYPSEVPPCIHATLCLNKMAPISLTRTEVPWKQEHSAASIKASTQAECQYRPKFIGISPVAHGPPGKHRSGTEEENAASGAKQTLGRYSVYYRKKIAE